MCLTGLSLTHANHPCQCPTGDAAGLRLVQKVRQRLTPLISSLEMQLQKVEAGNDSQGPPTPLLRAWMRASTFEGFALQAQLESVEAQLLAAAAPQQSGAQPAHPGADAGTQMLAIAGSMAEGSDLHLLLAAKALATARAAGAPAEAVSSKEGEVLRILELRYGSGLQPQTLDRLLQGALSALDRVAL